MIKRFMGIIALCLQVVPTFGILYKAQQVDIPLADGTHQKIILLGDNHEYLREVEKKDRPFLRNLTKEQRKEVIELAKEINATVLIEDIAYASPNISLLGAPSCIVAALDRYYGCYEHQVITNLTTECTKHGVKAYSVECRHPAMIVDAPPPYMPKLVKSVKKWAPLVGAATISATYIFNAAFAAIAAPVVLLASFIPHVAHHAAVPALQLQQYVENKKILNDAKELQKTSPFHACAWTKKLIEKLEEKLAQKPYRAIFRLVDIKALNYIATHPEVKTIIICAGAWHTNNLVEIFEEAGYAVYDFEHAYKTKKPMTINASGKPVRPLAIQETVKIDTRLVA